MIGCRDMSIAIWILQLVIRTIFLVYSARTLLIKIGMIFCSDRLLCRLFQFCMDSSVLEFTIVGAPGTQCGSTSWLCVWIMAGVRCVHVFACCLHFGLAYIIFIIIYRLLSILSDFLFLRFLNHPFFATLHQIQLTLSLLVNFMKILISGGGIAGLTLGLAAKKAGHVPLILEQRNTINTPSFGGGIGLWPPSQMVMERLGLLDSLQSSGMYMPSACYYDNQGNILAHPSSSFSQKFPVLCLEREQLLKNLSQKCLQENIQVRTQTKLVEAGSFHRQVRAQLSTNEQIIADLLIGSDGIGSKVRSLIMRQNGRPQITPHHCEYAYYRAVVDVKNNGKDQWHQHAFQSWGNGKRFGYVPLKSPKVFWFVAIPIGEGGLEKYIGSHLCSAKEKNWILQQIKSWKGPINIQELIQKTPHDTILRTDICKIKNVTSFPWTSPDNKMIILGDAANATAPNLAQGAGLAIQSAWDFVSALEQGNGFQAYIDKRKKRAQTVQGLADLVAQFGQLQKPASSARNFVMSTSTSLVRPLQERVFERVVSHSLGGDSQRLGWLPSNLPYLSDRKLLRQTSCLLGRIIGKESFQNLPAKTRLFRSSLIGSGLGKVSVSSIFFAKMFGLPSDMIDAPFGAYCETIYGKNGGEYQIWTRVFGEGKKNPTKYSTVHRATPALGIFKSGLGLTESLGLHLDLFRFGYKMNLQNDSLHYKSVGFWIGNYKVPFPLFLLPTSEWTQKYSENGWNFKGTISLPLIFGAYPLMKYEGSFEPTVCSGVKRSSKTVIIAGGTGMIGSKVARSFYLAGWNVQILSRKKKSIDHFPFAKVHRWNPSQANSQQELERLSKILSKNDLIINLSGQNPGSGLWTAATKTKILESRLTSIKTIRQALKLLKTSTPTFIQASAAGIYGDRGEQILLDNYEPINSTAFRITTCKQIQKLTKQGFHQAVILRIGHVFSSEGGLLPHLDLASKLRVKKLGKGSQYAPWVHIEDLSESIVHIAQNLEKYKGKNINIASPEHKTYKDILQKLSEVKGRRGCILSIPQTILKQVMGQISSVLLDSQRMHPNTLLQNNFQFKYANLEQALASRDCL